MKTNFKTKTILTAFLLGITPFANAQSTPIKGVIVKGGKPGIILSVGGGFYSPSSSVKDAYLVNSSGVGADVSIPLTSFRKGWDGKGHYLSINVGGQYNFGGSGNPSAKLPNAFPIFGSTSSSVAYKGVDPKNPGFKMGVGPQVNFNLGSKFTISPMVLAEYFSMTQKELSAVQTTEYNGQTYQKDLWTMPETKTSGLAVTPKIRMQYKITNSLGLFADASYILGPKVQTQLSTLVPTGAPNQDGFYEPDFVNNGTYVKGETKSASYSAFGVNVGMSFAFGGDKGWNGAAKKDDIQKGWNGKQEVSEFKELPKEIWAVNKGWDGTIKGLFEIKSENISVAKNGGIEKLIENINEGGKAKAKVYIIKEKKYIEIMEKEQNSFYEINDSGTGPLGIVIGIGGVVCHVTSCSCLVMPYQSSEACFCVTGTSTTTNSNCGPLGAALPITDYISSSQIKNLALALEPDGTTLTSGSVKNIKDLMLQSFPKATFEKAEIIKENKDKFVKVQLNEKGTPITLLNMTYNPGPGWILIGCSGTCHGSIYGCESKNINIVGACGCAGDNHCFGISHLFHGINSTISIEK